MKEIISVLTNCDFSLDYKSNNLKPLSEIIIITTAPKYVPNKKGDALIKDSRIEEFRFKTDLDGLNKLIGQLQLAVNQINHFEQMASGLNTIIEAHKPKTENNQH